MNQNSVVILKGKLGDLRRAASTLQSAGVQSEIIRPESCKANT